MAKQSKHYSLVGMLDLITASASDDETRHFMTRPYLDRGSLDDPEAPDVWTLAATDGRVLAVVQIEDAHLRLLYSGEPKPGYVSIMTAKKSINGIATIMPVPLDAQFPQWRKAVPAAENRLIVPGPDTLSEKPSMAIPIWTAMTRVALSLDYLTGKHAYMDGGEWSVDGEKPWSKPVMMRYSGPDASGKRSNTPGLVVTMPIAAIADDLPFGEAGRLHDIVASINGRG